MLRTTTALTLLALLAVTACNDAPIGGLIAILPQAPTTSADLELSIVEDSVDPNKKDLVEYDIAWLRDDEVMADLSGSTMVPSNETRKHQVWTVQVTPHDDKISGTTISTSVTVLNTPPVITNGSLTPSRPTQDDSIVVSVVHEDADDDAISFRYEWFVDGSGLDTPGPSLASDMFDKNQEIYVVVTPNDGEIDGEPYTVGTVTSKNSPPEISSADIDPQEAYELTELSCVPSGWFDADSDPEGYRYVWTVNSTDVGTASTLTGAYFDSGDVIRCQITPWDGEEEGSPRTSDPITVLNSLPALADVSIGPEGPREADLVQATIGASSDDDGDSVTFKYEWFVSGRSAATTTTLAGDNFGKGDRIYLEVTPFDGSDDGTPVRSNTVTAGNTAPSAPATVSIDPAKPLSSADLLCRVSGATDIDGDRLSYSIGWTVGGRGWTGATSTTTVKGDTIKSSDTTAGQVWACTAKAFDGTAYGAGLTATVTIVADWPGRAVFTNCGQTGYNGPSQAQCDSSYSRGTLKGKVTVKGGIQSFTIPSDGTYRVESWGAEGGHCSGRGGCGARGARMRGDFKLKRGDVLQIAVGQIGVGKGFGAGGGGGTFVVKPGPVALIIAGGGGGAGHILYSGGGASSGTTASCGTAGKFSRAGSGGCSGIGGYSSSSYAGSYNNSGGGGGLLGSGVGNGTRTNPGLSFKAGANGGADTGGFGGGGGGVQHSWSCSAGNGGGSGGGGYSGGGGGGGSCNGGGGGGGSYNKGSSASNSSGVRKGNGQVTIDKL